MMRNGFIIFFLITIFMLSPSQAKVNPFRDTLQTLDAGIEQVVFLSYEDGQYGLFGLEKIEGTWRVAFDWMEAEIGRNGLAPLGKKREGDGRTPSGMFELKRAFGYEPNIETGLEYSQVTENDFWIDDVESAQYNQWVKGPTQANSFERLRRDDDLYKYAIVIEYNTDSIVAGMGSAIFLHIWRGTDKPTAGCVALAEENVLKLLKWLDSSKKPVIILEP